MSFAFRVLKSLHTMDHVVMVPAYARQESQVSQEALVPQDQQALQVLPALKDPRDHEETKETQANREAMDHQAPRDLKGHWDLRVPQDQRVKEEPKVTQVLKEAKALLAPRDLQGHRKVTGNSVCFRIWTKERTVAWSR